MFKKNKIYEVLFVKIAVGKSYCLSAKNNLQEKMKRMPGFDSLYFANKETNEHIFRHDYVVFDNS